MNPRLVYAKGMLFPDNTEPNTLKPGPGFIQIGTEGGFLPQPAMVNGPKQVLLTLAPAERADLIVDLRNIPAGSTLILYSDAPAPYPMGDDRNDYYPGNPNTPVRSIPGYGPNTRTLLQIKVVKRVGAANPSITLPSTFHPTDPFLLKQTPGKPTAIPKEVQGQVPDAQRRFRRIWPFVAEAGHRRKTLSRYVRQGLHGRSYRSNPAWDDGSMGDT